MNRGYGTSNGSSMTRSASQTNSNQGLSSIVHQSVDAGGNGPSQSTKRNKRGFFSRLCCCGNTDTQNAGNSSTAARSDGNVPLLGAIQTRDSGKKCLVLDLDETLVHSSFKPVPNADYIIPVEIENTVHRVYVLKRPGVDEFMRRMGELYEIVIYTASLSKYADPLLDKLDPNKTIRWRLFREHCVYHEGHYVKDLSILGRDLKDSIIIDNSPMSYMFHPGSAIAVPSYIDDPADRYLPHMTPFLEHLVHVSDIRQHMMRYDPLASAKSMQNWD